MYPKSEHAEHWLDSDAMYMGLNGNISTFPLNASHIAGLVSATVLPPQARVLAAVIGIMFVSPRGIKMRELPKLFHVRRARIYDALQWLKNNNPLYQDVIISDNMLSQLPEEGAPDELLSTVRTSNDVMGLSAEQDSYVPDQDGWNSLGTPRVCFLVTPSTHRDTTLINLLANERGFVPVVGSETRPDPMTEPDNYCSRPITLNTNTLQTLFFCIRTV